MNINDKNRSLPHRKTLVVLTTTFPYESGETFLENESEYWKQYERVIVLATMVKNTEQPRTIPLEDVIVIPLKMTECGFAAKGLILLSSLFKKRVYDGIGEMIKEKKFSKSALKLYLHWELYARQQEKLLREKLSEIDLDGSDVVFYSYWMYISAVLAVELKRRFQGSIAVSRAHGFDLYEERHEGGFIPYRRWLLRNLDAIYPISQNGCEYLRSKYPVFGDKVHLARLGTKRYAGKTYQRKRDFLRIVSCSNVVPVKRVERILSTLEEVLDIEIEWVHYGEGKGLTELKENALKRLPSNVHTQFKGFVANRKLMEEYAGRDFDIFLNVSASEGVPVSIMEAMSFGIPVIATKVGGTGEIVEEGVNGFLLNANFADNDLRKLLLRIHKMTDDEYLTLRNNALRIWSERCSGDSLYRDFWREMANF